MILLIEGGGAKYFYILYCFRRFFLNRFSWF